MTILLDVPSWSQASLADLARETSGLSSAPEARGQEPVDTVSTSQAAFFREPAPFGHPAGKGPARLLPGADGSPLRASIHDRL